MGTRVNVKQTLAAVKPHTHTHTPMTEEVKSDQSFHGVHVVIQPHRSGAFLLLLNHT